VAFPNEEKPGMTRVLQNMGSVLFQVDHRQSPHFSVETPLLAAIVKGTIFEVTVGANDTLVSVTDGLVQVQSTASKAIQAVGKDYGGRVAENVPQTVVLVTPKELQQARAETRLSIATKVVGNATALRGRAAQAAVQTAAQSAAPTASQGANLAQSVSSLPETTASGSAAVRPKASSGAPTLLKDRGPVQVGQGVSSAGGLSWDSGSEDKDSKDEEGSNGLMMQVVVYGAGVVVAWFVILAGFVFIRASLRDLKGKPKKSKR
jgi:hypothetical protein